MRRWARTLRVAAEKCNLSGLQAVISALPCKAPFLSPFGTAYAVIRLWQNIFKTRDERDIPMQIQVNTDNHIHGSNHLTEEVESILDSMLSRFRDRITRVEVFLGDENSSQKTGEADKRCTMEARVAGMQPLAVSHHSNTVSQAIDGAAEKLLKSLTRTLDRLGETKGRTSFAGDQTN